MNKPQALYIIFLKTIFKPFRADFYYYFQMKSVAKEGRQKKQIFLETKKFRELARILA